MKGNEIGSRFEQRKRLMSTVNEVNGWIAKFVVALVTERSRHIDFILMR